MGFSKSLRGVRPSSLEGMIVSGADMCDTAGARGIVRCLTYAVSDKGSGEIFNREIWPLEDMTAEVYNAGGSTYNTDSFINHFFEKVLKLRDMILTEPGRHEAERRHEVVVGFLDGFFREENASEWQELLARYR